jgi:hypothetical protein
VRNHYGTKLWYTVQKKLLRSSQKPSSRAVVERIAPSPNSWFQNRGLFRVGVCVSRLWSHNITTGKTKSSKLIVNDCRTKPLFNYKRYLYLSNISLLICDFKQQQGTSPNPKVFPKNSSGGINPIVRV